MTVKFQRLSSSIADLLRRIPGRGSVTILIWLAPLLPAAGAVFYVTASSPSWAPVTAASAFIAILATGPVWWLLRSPLRTLPHTPRNGLVCLIAYASVGFVGGIVVIGVLHVGSPDVARPDMLSTSSVLLTTTIMTTLLSAFIVISASWRWDLYSAMAVAQSRRKYISESLIQRDFTDSAERHALATAMTVEIIEPLTIAERDISESPAMVSDQLETLAGEAVRPLSHRFHSVDSTQLTPLALTGFPFTEADVAEVPIRRTLRRPLHAGIPIWLLTLISVPGSLLISITDPLAGWWVPPLNLLTILCALALVSYLPPILDPRVPSGWRQWAVLAGLYTAVGIVTGVVLALLTSQSELDLVLTAISFHLLTGLIASVQRTWWLSTREEQRRFNAESLALRAEDLRALAHARQLRTRAAMILHSQVQTRLLAIASLLALEEPRTDQAIEALRQIRDDVLSSLRSDILSSSLPGATGLDSTSLQRAFPGITIRMSIRPSASALHEHTRAATVSDLITEAVANAIRHGDASNLDINVTVDEEVLELSVEDDGSGIPLDHQIKPGLGLSVIRAVSRDWALRPASLGGTQLKVTLDSPGESAIKALTANKPGNTSTSQESPFHLADKDVERVHQSIGNRAPRKHSKASIARRSSDP